MAKAIPDGFQSVTPSLTFKDSNKALEFYKKAFGAGATEVMPVGDMFWGDRMGALKDPFGYQWSVATQKKILSNDEVRKGAEAFFTGMSKKS